MFSKGSKGGSQDQPVDDFAAADPEGAAAVLSGVMSVLSGGASLLSSGVHRLSGSGAGPQLDANAADAAVDGGDVDPLSGQPLRRAVGAGSVDVSQEEKIAIEAEERAKSSAYAAVEVKAKVQKQL